MILILIAVIFLTSLLAYSYVKYKYGYWKRLGLSGPKPVFPLGNFDFVVSKRLDFEDRRASSEHGSIYGMYEGLSPVLVVAEPELVRQMYLKDFHLFTNRRFFGVRKQKLLDKMLFFMEDEKWRETRSLMSPTFTSGKMKRMFALVNFCANILMENMTEIADTVREVNVMEPFGAFTMDVIARCAFAVKINSQKDANNAFVTHSNSFFKPSKLQMVFSFVFPALGKLLGYDFMKPDDYNYFDNAIRRIVDERRTRKSSDFNDFLQILIDAKEGNDEDDDEDELDERKLKMKATRRLRENEFLAQCVLFFVGGYETTKTVLAFSTYCLAIHNEYQERLHEELVNEFDNFEDLDYERLMKLPMLDAILNEILRMYSPFIRLERVVATEYQIPGLNFKLPKYMNVTIPIHVMHFNEKFFPEPETFRPERFLPENKDKIVPYSYLPFGIGPRYCIGSRFALMETKLALAKLIAKFQFSVCSKTSIPPEYDTCRGLLHPKDITLKVDRR